MQGKQIVAVFLPQFASRSLILPEEAFGTILGLIPRVKAVRTALVV